MIAVARTVVAALLRRFTYPGYQGHPTRHDPTHGQIDRDIQWKVRDIYGDRSLAQRAAVENTLQQRRGYRKAHR